MNRQKKNIFLGLFMALIMSVFCVRTVEAQVKIGDNHETINAGSLLELESTSKGLMFPRIALDSDLSVWKLDGNAMDGMVVFNTNTQKPEGLYCWYNDQWNHLSGGGTMIEMDTLSFNTDTRTLYDDGDSVEIPSGRVSVVSSVDILQQHLVNGTVQEGDIFYLTGGGLYIKNNVTNTTNVSDGYIFVPAMPSPGRILYANYSAVTLVHDSAKFQWAVPDSFYQEPDNPQILNVLAPDDAGNNGYYAFAVPNTWANPRIFMKVKNTGDKPDEGFYKLNNCWQVTREMEYDGQLYQVWTLDVPMRKSVMELDNNGFGQFMIE